MLLGERPRGSAGWAGASAGLGVGMNTFRRVATRPEAAELGATCSGRGSASSAACVWFGRLVVLVLLLLLPKANHDLPAAWCCMPSGPVAGGGGAAAGAGSYMASRLSSLSSATRVSL